MKPLSRIAAVVFAVAVSAAGPTCAAQPASLDDALAAFSEHWREADWVPKTGRRTKFMRPLNDPGWKARMLALHAIVKAGADAVKPMRQMLRSGSGPERALAAQALGYLPAKAAREELIEAAIGDERDVVRLYAIDSLGMLGENGVSVDWESIGKRQKNRDVKRHLAYAEQRAGKPVEPAIVETLANWDATKMDTARVGQPAPDFELSSVDGQKVRLSDYRGRQAIVLVFIYGDT